MDGPIGKRVIFNRATGEIVADAGYIYAEDFPLPPLHPSQPLLKYMDLSKFEDLLKSSALYLRRADKFRDSLEGTLSDEGIHGTSRSDMAFSEKIKVAGSYAEKANYRATAKAANFVACFTINDRPCDRMWSEYTKSSESVMILTTVGLLHQALPSYMGGGQVRYVEKTTPRSEFDERSLFFYKDKGFEFEQEYRVIADFRQIDGPNSTGIHFDLESDFFRRVPVNLPVLIKGVNPHPQATAETISTIDGLIRTHIPAGEWRLQD